MKLGNLKRLVLTGNSIRSLNGLRKLFCLQFLDLKDNSLAQVADVWPVGRLPCLDTLILTGNPVEAIVEYRTRVLEAFGMRAGEVHLDNERASQKELDTVSVRLAIRKAKDEKEAMVERTRMQIGEKLKFLSADESFGDECTIAYNIINLRQLPLDIIGVMHLQSRLFGLFLAFILIQYSASVPAKKHDQKTIMSTRSFSCTVCQIMMTVLNSEPHATLEQATKDASGQCTKLGTLIASCMSIVEALAVSSVLVTSVKSQDGGPINCLFCELFALVVEENMHLPLVRFTCLLNSLEIEHLHK
uniref:Uncharacterized protein n=1 Tax=Plectus sambesii TaxID=2011161 RepID=A0A914WJJ3_9BILA